MTTPQTTTQTTLDADRRWRERLAAVTAAWRLVDRQLDEVMEHPFDYGRMQALLRHRQRMTDELDLLERDWILRHGGLR